MERHLWLSSTGRSLWQRWQHRRGKARLTCTWLWQILMAQGPEGQARFSSYYTQLRALPRATRRALQGRLAQSLAGVAVLMALGQAPAWAGTTINVAASDEAGLIQAITDANSETGSFVGTDTIVLANSTFVLTTPIDGYGPAGLPLISSSIIIQGNGSTITRDPTAVEFRIISVGSEGTLAVQDTTISGGVTSTEGVTSPRGGGAAIYFGGTLTLTNSTVSGNSSAGSGGGVDIYFGGTLTLTDSMVSGNSADFGAGGVSNGSGTVTLTNSTVSGNLTSDRAGGVFNSIGTLTLTNSTVSGNSAAGSGGGLYSSGGILTLTNSTVSGNSSGFNGGGVIGSGATMTVTNSTVSGNSAGFIGGGLANYGTLTLTHSTVSGNTATLGGGVSNSVVGILILNRTLISGNTASNGAEVFNNSGTVTASNFNLFGLNGDAGVVNFSPGASDIVPGSGVLLNSILSPLALNAPGTTQTHALLSGSPAIDAVLAGCPPPTTDQRGVARPQGEACDIGAFEAGEPVCGNGVVEGGEQCEDLNTTSGDGCSATCQSEPPGGVCAVCGNGTTEGIEACDDGNTTNGDGCSATCQIETPPPTECPVCGDGTTEGIEACDDGNTTNGDGCSATCQTEPPDLALCNGAAPTAGCTVNGVPNQPCVGTSGNDTINGTSGNDIVAGLGGNDTLNGGQGQDCLAGGTGQDVLNGGAQNDVLEGGSGDDLLDGALGNDRLVGGVGNDQLVGGPQNDILDGGDGDDVLLGGQDNDTLAGGVGTDSLDGGPQVDTCTDTDQAGPFPNCP